MTSEQFVMPLASVNQQLSYIETKKKKGLVAPPGKPGTGRDSVKVKETCENGYRSSLLLTQAWERSLVEFRSEKKDGDNLASSDKEENANENNTHIVKRIKMAFVDCKVAESLPQQLKESLEDSTFDNASSVNGNSFDQDTLPRQNCGRAVEPERNSASPRRRPPLLEEEPGDPLSHRNSHETRATASRQSSLLDDDRFNSTAINLASTAEEPRGQCDSLVETVLETKKGDGGEMVSADNTDSGISIPYSLSSASSSINPECPVCPCDDCLLGLTDLIAAQSSLSKPKKLSNWRKVRNVVQWTPFIQTYKRNKYPWVQLAGHHGNFKAGSKQGTILKKLCPTEEKALDVLMADALRQYVPQFIGVLDDSEGEKYLQLQDLLSAFNSPCVMDIKMGVRTYLEDELAKARENPKLRKDMYKKMVQIDPDAPTPEEHLVEAVTKPRYMVWRETLSSTATLGFRIEGVRREDGTSTKDFKTTRTREQVSQALKGFVEGYPHAVEVYIQRLKSIKTVLVNSSFFRTHEFIGSSLLFVHNESSASVWLIDFAKTVPLPEGVTIDHRSVWVEGTHEDGYMIGLDNLIELFVSLKLAALCSSSDSSRTSFASPPTSSSSNSKASKSAGS